MKFFECVFKAAVCLGVIAASRLSNKYLPANFEAVGVTGSSQYPHYHTVSGAASRLRPSIEHQYATSVSAPVHAASHFSHKKMPAQIPILRNDYNNDGSGNYNFGFETGNGIKRDESGHFQGSWPGGSIKVSGSYSYTGDDGKLYSINYKADRHGFRAEGDHLPTPPPIPRVIQETLHLHQHDGNQHGATDYAAAADYSSSGHRNFFGGSHLSTVNGLVPNPKYLPPQQVQGYNYVRHH